MVGIETGELSEFDTFDKLLDALYKQFDARLDLDEYNNTIFGQGQ